MKVNHLTTGVRYPVKGYFLRESGEKIEFDAVMSSNHTHTAKVTNHPVEKGVSVSDFSRPEPVRLKIAGIISNHPIELPGSQVNGITTVDKKFTWTAEPNVPILGNIAGPSGVIGSVGGIIGGLTGIDQRSGTAMGFSKEFWRVEDCYSILIEMLNAGETFSVITTLARYDGVVMESLVVTRDAKRSNILDFTVDVRQIIIVETAYADAPTTFIDTAKKEVKKGKQAPKVEETPADSESLAHKAKETGKAVYEQIKAAIGGG
jgi:hypothetical protein